MLLQLIGVPHWFLLNMWLRVSVSVGVSRRWCTGVVFMQPGVKVNGAYYCDVLLVKQFLPDICITRAQEHWAAETPDFTPDVASQQTRPQFCSLQIIESHSGMHSSETARDLKHCWWAVVINSDILLTEWHSQGRVETSISIGGQLCYSSVAKLLQYLCAKNYQNIMQLDKVIAKK